VVDLALQLGQLRLRRLEARRGPRDLGAAMRQRAFGIRQLELGRGERGLPVDQPGFGAGCRLLQARDPALGVHRDTRQRRLVGEAGELHAPIGQIVLALAQHAHAPVQLVPHLGQPVLARGQLIGELRFLAAQRLQVALALAEPRKALVEPFAHRVEARLCARGVAV
jgi:hypothetical protein